MKSIVRTAIAFTAAAVGLAAAAHAQPIPATETGWVLRQEQGSCLIQKGADTQYRLQMTSRGRMLLSAPNLGDQYFADGQAAPLRLGWSDGVEQQVDAAMITLPGGGAQSLLPRQVYVVPLDTTSLATRFPSGFTLVAFRGDTQVFTFDGRDAAPFLRSYNQCESKIGLPPEEKDD